TWSATARSWSATRRSHLHCLRNTADSCAQFFQNIRVLKSKQLEMVSWSNFPAHWRQCNAGLKFKKRLQKEIPPIHRKGYSRCVSEFMLAMLCGAMTMWLG